MRKQAGPGYTEELMCLGELVNPPEKLVEVKFCLNQQRNDLMDEHTSIKHSPFRVNSLFSQLISLLLRYSFKQSHSN